MTADTPTPAQVLREEAKRLTHAYADEKLARYGLNVSSAKADPDAAFKALNAAIDQLAALAEQAPLAPVAVNEEWAADLLGIPRTEVLVPEFSEYQRERIACVLKGARAIRAVAAEAVQQPGLLAVLQEIAEMTYDPWTNGARAGDLARAALSAPAAPTVALPPENTNVHQAELRGSDSPLPPLPPTGYVLGVEGDGYSDDRLFYEAAYDAGQMRDYALAALANKPTATKEARTNHPRSAGGGAEPAGAGGQPTGEML